MEDSLSSSTNKSVGSKGTTDINPEESGWTAYFEDFASNQNQHSSCSYNTLVSDAASYVERKVSNNTNMGGLPKFSKELKFKKTRTKEISFDDSLEDTASSPVNSPKVGSLKQMSMEQGEEDNNNIENSLGKGCGSDHHIELHTDEMVFEGKNNNESTDLRKRGLCLVPLSTLLNYLG